MEDTDHDCTQSTRHLTLSLENFVDYLASLTSKLRFNLDVDRVLSDETHHPLLVFQQTNNVVLATFNVS